MDFLVSRDPAVPLRCQIRARLTAEIRDGGLAAGARLPTVRALAERLEVHRNTVWAAYRELARDRLVRAVPGGGVYVAEPAPPSVSGIAGGLVLVETAPALRRLLARELEAAVGAPVPAIGAAELTRDPGRWAGFHLTARPARLAALRRRVPAAAVFALPLAGGLDELARVRRLAGPGVIAVLTISPTVRRQARALLAPLRRLGIGGAFPDPADRWAVERALGVAALVVADAVCMEEAGPSLADRSGRRPLVRLRVLRTEALAGPGGRPTRRRPARRRRVRNRVESGVERGS